MVVAPSGGAPDKARDDRQLPPLQRRQQHAVHADLGALEFNVGVLVMVVGDDQVGRVVLLRRNAERTEGRGDHPAAEAFAQRQNLVVDARRQFGDDGKRAAQVLKFSDEGVHFT